MVRKCDKKSEAPSPEEIRFRHARSLRAFNLELALARQHIRLLANPDIMIIPAPRRRRRSGQ